MFKIRKEGNSNVPQTSSLFIEKGRRWNSNPSGKYLYERPTRGTVCGTMRSMCGADVGCLAINYQYLCSRIRLHDCEKS